MKRAVFLDRDGTIIEDVGYLNERSRIKFLPRASEAIRLLNETGFKVIIATNQSGVARGYFTEEKLREINSYIQESLAEHGAFIDETYYCPHHVEGIIEEYKKECYYRKPNPGMIEKAAVEFDISLKDSFVVGDKITDIEAGHRAGCQTILLSDKESASKEELALKPDYIAGDLYEATSWLVSFSRQEVLRKS
ncbi:D-glycero-alpha-D-manno-heptose-1,7-bisphosphate 7-phosphatase [Chloroflexota bacterium]